MVERYIMNEVAPDKCVVMPEGDIPAQDNGNGGD